LHSLLAALSLPGLSLLLLALLAAGASLLTLLAALLWTLSVRLFVTWHKRTPFKSYLPLCGKARAAAGNRA